MRAMLLHMRIRFSWILRAPLPAAGVIVLGLLAWVAWPAALRPDGWFSDARGPRPHSWNSFVQIQMILIVGYASRLVGGRATGRSIVAWRTVQPLPTLPIGIHGRMIAEALLALVLLLVLRLAGLAIAGSGVGHFLLRHAVRPDGGLAAIYLGMTGVGAWLLFPMLLAWAVPAVQPERALATSVAVMAGTFVLMKLNALATPAGCIASGALLSAAVLVSTGRKLPFRLPKWPALLPRDRRTDSRSTMMAVPAKSRAPRAQWRHDIFLRPFRLAWIGLPFLALGLVLDRTVLSGWRLGGEEGFSPFALAGGGAVMLFGTFLLRAPLAIWAPMPSGALLRAASVLPLERRGIVRSLYAWFFAAGMLTWLFLVALILLSSWMHGGRSSLGAIDGESAAPTLLGLLALVPAAAAGSLAQAVGARTATAIAGGLMILGLAAMMVLSSASVAPEILGAVMAGLALAGLVLAVPVLRRSRMPRD